MLTFEVLCPDGLAGVDEPALVGPARHVAKVLPEVGQAGGAARQHRLGQVEVGLHVVNLWRVFNALDEYFSYNIQGDHSGCSQPPVDSKTKVAF